MHTLAFADHSTGREHSVVAVQHGAAWGSRDCLAVHSYGCCSHIQHLRLFACLHLFAAGLVAALVRVRLTPGQQLTWVQWAAQQTTTSALISVPLLCVTICINACAHAAKVRDGTCRCLDSFCDGSDHNISLPEASARADLHIFLHVNPHSVHQSSQPGPSASRAPACGQVNWAMPWPAYLAANLTWSACSFGLTMAGALLAGRRQLSRAKLDVHGSGAITPGPGSLDLERQPGCVTSDSRFLCAGSSSAMASC